LPGRDQKRYRVNKSEQPNDNESRQPIRISTREKLFEGVFVIHHGETWKLPGGRIELPTKGL
jgi:hypothetical protein